MVSKTVEFVFKVFLFIIGVLIFISFLFQILGLVEKASGLVSNITEEPEEVIETIPRRPLEINDKDSPDVMVYKLLKNFDPMFLNETNGNNILYNSFTLYLRGNIYGDGTGPSSTFINNITQGLKDFNSVDNLFQIGDNSQQPPNCGFTENTNLDFYNECWDTSIDHEPSINPCEIYVSGYIDHGFDTHTFRNRVKIKVKWYTDGTVGDKEIIHTIVAICNDNAMSI